MPHGYNSLNDMQIDDLSIGLCPVCNKRLTAECEHIQNDEAQEWLAAYIVAETILHRSSVNSEPFLPDGTPAWLAEAEDWNDEQQTRESVFPY